jgi:cytoskeletal protein CcmA (bactofilin family)
VPATPERIKPMKLKKKAVNNIGAFLGSDSEFEGHLTFQGTIRIDGTYKGNITVEGTLIVGPTGKVNAEISAGNMIISGEVTGNMTAKRNIEVQVTGKVYGNMVSPTVTIHEGAIFQGQCYTSEKRAGDQKKLSILHPAQKDDIPGEPEDTDNPSSKSA